MTVIEITKIHLFINDSDEENITLTKLPTFADIITWYYYGNGPIEPKVIDSIIFRNKNKQDKDRTYNTYDPSNAVSSPPAFEQQISVMSTQSVRSILKDQILYFSTQKDRFIGSTSWIDVRKYISQVDIM